MTEAIINICKSYGCIFAKTSNGGEDAPPKGVVYCALGLNPDETLTEKGCEAAATGSTNQIWSTYTYGTMKTEGFIERQATG